MFENLNEEISEEQIDEMIEKLAEKVHQRKMEVPDILALEMHKPLAHVGSNAAVAFAPFLVPFFGYDRVQDIARFLGKPGSIERLIQRLESKAAPRSKSLSRGSN